MFVYHLVWLTTYLSIYVSSYPHLYLCLYSYLSIYNPISTNTYARASEHIFTSLFICIMLACDYVYMPIHKHISIWICAYTASISISLSMYTSICPSIYPISLSSLSNGRFKVYCRGSHDTLICDIIESSPG